jgi:hypothetical protein
LNEFIAGRRCGRDGGRKTRFPCSNLLALLPPVPAVGERGKQPQTDYNECKSGDLAQTHSLWRVRMKVDPSWRLNRLNCGRSISFRLILWVHG